MHSTTETSPYGAMVSQALCLQLMPSSLKRIINSVKRMVNVLQTLLEYITSSACALLMSLRLPSCWLTSDIAFDTEPRAKLILLPLESSRNNRNTAYGRNTVRREIISLSQKHLRHILLHTYKTQATTSINCL